MIGVLDSLKIAAGIMAGAVLMYPPAYLHGRMAAKSQTEAEASKEALERIQTLEKNNASFKSLSDRDKCVEFMRFSGLPESECGG